MTLLELKLSTLLLTDVQRRSFYVALTLCDRTVWLQWWPRPIAGRRMLTCGIRVPAEEKQ